jgi:type II secretory pathway component PulF
LHVKKRAQFYQSLGTLYEAGVPLAKALKTPLPQPFGRVAINLAASLESTGGSLSEAMARHPRVFSRFECSLVRVGEKTGRLATVFTNLREWCDFRIRMRGTVLSGLAYPALLYHVAAILLPAIGLISGRGSVLGTALAIGLWTVLPYVVLALVALVSKGLADSAVGGRVALALPVVGRLVEKAQLAQFFRGYEMALEAGVHAPQAVVLSAEGCRNAVIRRAMVSAGKEAERQRRPPGEILANHLPGGGRRHAMAVQLLGTGEEAGRSDEMAGRIAALYAEETVRACEVLAKLTPKLIYIVIMLAVAWQIIKSFMGIYGGLPLS